MFYQESYGFFEILFYQPLIIDNNNKIINILDEADWCRFLGLAKESLMAFSSHTFRPFEVNHSGLLFGSYILF
jgi:hypothetical protein